MLTMLLSLLLLHHAPMFEASARPVFVTDATRTLSDILMDDFKTMDGAAKGIFSEEVSSTIAPYFPTGLSFAQTEAVVEREKLGRLKLFKGKQDMPGGTMYVTRIMLMGGIVADVSVVLVFDFTGTVERNMVLSGARAYVRATPM